MNQTIGVVIGASAGLVITIVGTLLFPSKPRWLRILIPPVLGFGAAYAVITLM